MKKLLLILIAKAITITAQITPANNIIAIDINQPQNAAYTYDSAYSTCYNLGMRQVGLSFPWPNIETSPNVYNLTLLDIANLYYPASNMPVDLTLAPINTNIKSVPSDLAALAFDDPAMIARFKKLIDSVFAHIPNLQLSSLVIGSEVDIYLGSNPSLWTQYINFYSQVSAYARTLRPSLKVSCEAKLEGLTTTSITYLQTLNAFSDYIGVSYYPLHADFTVEPFTTVASDINALVTTYPTKPICFYQYGFPSDAVCNSSNALQAQFITQTFSSWDAHAANIRMIDFTWMHDYSPAAVSAAAAYYGLSSPGFLGFLGSLGLRTYAGNGSNKPAFDELICQAKMHGYNNLPTVCSSSLNDISSETPAISIFPNPASSVVNIISENTMDEIKVENALGQIIQQLQPKQKTISLSLPKPGIYFISIKTEKQTLIRKRIINQ